jgi:hypothetical protein
MRCATRMRNRTEPEKWKISPSSCESQTSFLNSTFTVPPIELTFPDLPLTWVLPNSWSYSSCFLPGLEELQECLPLVNLVPIPSLSRPSSSPSWDPTSSYSAASPSNDRARASPLLHLPFGFASSSNQRLNRLLSSRY